MVNPTASGKEAKRRILVVDDEPTVREVVATYLDQAGFEVLQLADGAHVIEVIEQFRPDLVVLDLMLPIRSGFDILREIRSTSQLPVILLTARSDEVDRIVGLELGGDDYVVKPFSPRELAARVQSVLRRTTAPPTSNEDSQRVLDFDNLKIHPVSREVFFNDVLIALTAKEFDLLTFLAASPRHVFSRTDLLREVWDSDPKFQDPATVTVHVRRLRAKIETDPDNPTRIATVFGVGYRFEP